MQNQICYVGIDICVLCIWYGSISSSCWRTLIIQKKKNEDFFGYDIIYAIERSLLSTQVNDTLLLTNIYIQSRTIKNLY